MPEALSAAIARHVATTRFADLPEATVAATKRALLDGVGVMLAASGAAPEVLPFVELARAAGAGRSTILGFDVMVPAAEAAFANGAMAHALDYEDAFDLAPTHPNASLIPAVLALAQAHGPVSGEALIVAVAVGCDVACRLALSLRRPMEEGGWYPPPILGAFGAAAAASSLLGLQARQVCDAFSLMLCQVSCPGEIKYDRDTVLRAVREAFPAKSAVTAAELAARGVRGFEAPFEGRAGFFRLYALGDYAPEAILEGLGRHYWIDQLSFKPWPSCRGTHAYVEAALALKRAHGLAPEGIAAIEVTGGEVHRMLMEPAERKASPATVIDAKFSIPFTVASVLVDDRLDLDSFADAALGSAAKRSLAAKVQFHFRPDWGRDKAAAGALALVTVDGRRLVQEVPVALGAPSRPLSAGALRAKFLDCAARAAVRAADAGGFADAVERLETITNVNALLGLLATKKALA